MFFAKKKVWAGYSLKQIGSGIAQIKNLVNHYQLKPDKEFSEPLSVRIR